MNLSTQKAVAAAAFIAALGASLVVFPLVLDPQALAVDSAGHGHMPLPSARIEGRLAFLKTALNITDAQSAEWNALADVMRKQAKDSDADMKLTAIDRMERRQAALSELLTAAKPLYAVLSDEQKQTADELLTPRMTELDGPRHGAGAGES